MSDEDKDSHACSLCEKMFPTRKRLKRHFYEHAKQDSGTKYKRVVPPTTCEICNLSFGASAYWKHYNTCHPDWRGIDCEHCGTHFHHYKEYLRHRAERHSIEQQQQDNPDLATANDDGERLYMKCPICPALFLNRGALRNHVLIHERVYRAGYKFEGQWTPESTKLALATVLLEDVKGSLHVDKNSNNCETKRFNSSRAAKAAAAAVALCKHCQCRFVNRIGMAQHLVTHQEFLCLECGQVMNTDEQFVKHQEVHLPPILSDYNESI